MKRILRIEDEVLKKLWRQHQCHWVWIFLQPKHLRLQLCNDQNWDHQSLLKVIQAKIRVRCGFFMCVNRSPPRRVNRFAWNFGDVYSSTRAIAWGTFSLPVGTSKPEVGYFSETGSWKHRNRKSKSIPSESSWVLVMKVLSSFFDISILVVARIIFVRVCLYTLP